MKYTVIVGNIGTVHTGDYRRKAIFEFVQYRMASKAGTGRAGHEPVTLFEDNEILMEHNPDQGDV